MFGERLEAAILSKTSETVGGFRIVGTGISRDTRIADYREILQLAVIIFLEETWRSKNANRQTSILASTKYYSFEPLLRRPQNRVRD